MCVGGALVCNSVENEDCKCITDEDIIYELHRQSGRQCVA